MSCLFSREGAVEVLTRLRIKNGHVHVPGPSHVQRQRELDKSVKIMCSLHPLHLAQPPPHTGAHHWICPHSSPSAWVCDGYGEGVIIIVVVVIVVIVIVIVVVIIVVVAADGVNGADGTHDNVGGYSDEGEEIQNSSLRAATLATAAFSNISKII